MAIADTTHANQAEIEPIKPEPKRPPEFSFIMPMVVLTREKSVFEVEHKDLEEDHSTYESFRSNRLVAGYASKKSKGIISIRSKTMHAGLECLMAMIQAFDRYGDFWTKDAQNHWVTAWQNNSEKKSYSLRAVEWIKVYANGEMKFSNLELPIFDDIEREAAGAPIDKTILNKVGRKKYLGTEFKLVSTAHDSAVAVVIENQTLMVKTKMTNRRLYRSGRLSFTIKQDRQGARLDAAIDVAAKIINLTNSLEEYTIAKQKFSEKETDYLKARDLFILEIEEMRRLERAIIVATNNFDIDFLPDKPIFDLPGAPAAKK